MQYLSRKEVEPGLWEFSYKQTYGKASLQLQFRLDSDNPSNAVYRKWCKAGKEMIEKHVREQLAEVLEKVNAETKPKQDER
jgi:hypothetical protein